MVLGAIEDWTGDRPPTCPWRAFWDPLVRQVLHAYPWFLKQQLAIVEPEPSNRLVEGIAHYHHALSAVEFKQIEQERKEAQAKAGAR